MAHTLREKQKLLARVRRIKGQVESIERSLDSEAECGQVMHLIAGVRGSLAGLMAEGVEGHTHTHPVDPEVSEGTGREAATIARSNSRLSEMRHVSDRRHLRRHIAISFLAWARDQRTQDMGVIWLCGAMMIARLSAASCSAPSRSSQTAST